MIAIAYFECMCEFPDFFFTLDAPCLKIPQCFHSAPRPPSFISSVTSFISPDKLPHTLSSFFKEYFLGVLFQGEIDLIHLRQLLSSGRVKLMACAHMSNVLGTIHPIRTVSPIPQLLICPRPFSPFFEFIIFFSLSILYSFRFLTY